MLADEFKDTSWKGELRPKSQVLRELPGRRTQHKQTMADLDADLFGDTAVVRGVNVITDQQAHEVMRIRFTDVLRFVNHRWQAIAAQQTPEQRPYSFRRSCRPRVLSCTVSFRGENHESYASRFHRCYGGRCGIDGT